MPFAAVQEMNIRDKYNRIIDYMRISITDRCNLRCIYCMPSSGVIPFEHKELLTYEEITKIIEVAATLGVKKIRITGGEPLARKNVAGLIAAIRGINGIEDISLTTNGLLLETYAKELSDAGLTRINVSLDSLKPGKYREITRGGDIGLVMKGIQSAEKAGLAPIKINMVPIRGFNDDEIEEFARITLSTPYHVRFIEFMPIGARDLWSKEKHIPTAEIRAVVEQIGALTPVRMRKNGPARYFMLDGAAGVIGFISALTNHFCGDCNRLRVTSDGKIRPCLFSETEIDLKPALRNNTSDNEIERLLRLSIEVKPEGHNINHKNGFESLRAMSKIGG